MAMVNTLILNRSTFTINIYSHTRVMDVDKSKDRNAILNVPSTQNQYSCSVIHYTKGRAVDTQYVEVCFVYIVGSSSEY
jgi:hypothetical protein